MISTPYILDQYEKHVKQIWGGCSVLGSGCSKMKIRDALKPVWNGFRSRYDEDNTTGEELNFFVREQARKVPFGIGAYAGHLIGDFSHEYIPKDKITFYMTKRNKCPK